MLIMSEKISKADFAHALSQLLAEKPSLIEAVQETMEDIWAKKSAIAAKKSGLANKSAILNDLYGSWVFKTIW